MLETLSVICGRYPMLFKTSCLLKPTHSLVVFSQRLSSWSAAGRTWLRINQGWSLSYWRGSSGSINITLKLVHQRLIQFQSVGLFSLIASRLILTLLYLSSESLDETSAIPFQRHYQGKDFSGRNCKRTLAYALVHGLTKRLLIAPDIWGYSSQKKCSNLAPHPAWGCRYTLFNENPWNGPARWWKYSRYINHR